MSYRYATENISYEDYSSGRVFYNQQGATAFPVRLISEIFLRCAEILRNNGKDGPFTIYDPLSGGAYSLASLGFLHGDRVKKIYASDIDPAMVMLAEKNLSLLTGSGLKVRIEQINNMIEEFGKESHCEALQSALRFQNVLEQRKNQIETNCFVSDATGIGNQCDLKNIDIVISDLPYGEVVQWECSDSGREAIELMLENLLPKLSPASVIAVIARKKTPINHKQYRRVEHFTIGKRQVVFLQPIHQENSN